MLSFQRREQIKQMLIKQKSITVTAVAEQFGVSDETIRRDLNVLSDEGFCNKTYGGAFLATRSTSHIPQRMKKDLFVDEKRFMAKIAASFIRPKDCIFLDHSTTVSELCHEIKSMSLTVVTNSLWVISELSDLENIDLVVTGGHCRTMDRGMFGQETLNFLNHHYFDKAFFSCRGLNIDNGIFDASEHTASFHQALIDRAAETFLMADHTKFGVAGFINITSYSEIDNFITDSQLDASWQEIFETNGVKVLNTLARDTQN
ncbi:MAG: DeoR/GlpR transcriptional regulator [Subdoligranulum sp.]|nr:DeoR/GlpR transcriptional regulator [Subdoligranulum sp.]MBD5101713.1 DeoR/GlpR transcriptional regulator [Subdoligranulum sp.]